MTAALALIASTGVLALLVLAIGFLRRRSFVVRQLTFPLVVAALAATLEVFGRLRPGYPWLPAALSWTLLFLGLITILRLLALLLFDVHLLGQRGVRLPPLLPAVAMALVYLVTALVTLKLRFPAFDIGPLLATSAVTSLVLGLALQPILANFFAGLVISLERPFRINDWIRVGEQQEGRVVAITWRTTHLRTRDNDNIVIPNAKLAEDRVHNFYYPHPLHLERIRVPVHYKEPPYRVRRVLTDCAAGVPGTLDKPSPDVYLIAFEDSAVIYELRVWIDDVANAPRIASDLRARAWEELRKAGMTIPYPTRTLHLAPRIPSRRPERQRPGGTGGAGDAGGGQGGGSCGRRGCSGDLRSRRRAGSRGRPAGSRENRARRCGTQRRPGRPADRGSGPRGRRAPGRAGGRPDAVPAVRARGTRARPVAGALRRAGHRRALPLLHPAPHRPERQQGTHADRLGVRQLRADRPRQQLRHPSQRPGGQPGRPLAARSHRRRRHRYDLRDG